MFYKKISVLLIIILISFSCTSKRLINPVLTKDNLIYEIRKNNPYSCNLKRKGVFFIENRFNKTKFKGYIIKKCNNDFVLNILGAFNRVAYKAVFKDGKLDIFKANKSVKDELSLMLTDQEVAKLASLLNIPLVIPDENYEIFKVTNDKYILTKAELKVTVDRNSYKILKIEKNQSFLKYSYEDNQIYKLHFFDQNVEISISFL
jgi:hypothetical protein